MIDSQQGRRRCIDHIQDRRSIIRHVRFLSPEGSRIERELEECLDVKTSPPAVFLVTRDPLAASHANIRHLEERDQFAVLAVEPGLANGTEVEGVVTERATSAAEPPLDASLVETAGRRLEAHNLPLGSLVIDDVPGTELAKRKKAWPVDEFPLLSRNPCADGKGGEVVTGQKAFTGQIPVGIEVGLLAAHVRLEQEIALSHRLLLAGVGRGLVGGTPGSHQLVGGLVELPCRRAEEFSPAIEGPVEPRWCFVDDALNPRVIEPTAGGEKAGIGRQHAANPLSQLEPGRLAKLDLTRGIFLQQQAVQAAVDDLLDGLAEGKADLREPGGLHVSPQERLICQVETRRAHTPRDHIRSTVEEVLVVTVERSAIREDQAWLSLAPARPLRWA